MPAETAAKKEVDTNLAGEKKSGLRTLKSGDILFNENDPADSLYIIQKGQIRLYRPKGKGFVELAVLRAGEVIGEMAFFDIEGGGRRSCSAQAIATTDVIEISFKAFGKTMAGLNPWFKTIIETLAKRLRKTNAKVKELESNQVSNYGKESPGYHFFRDVDIVRLLSVVFLAMKSHGKVTSEGVNMHKNLLKFYAIDIFNIAEVKYEEFIALLRDHGLLRMEKDEDNLPNIVNVFDIERIRYLLVFFNNQRNTSDDKKLKIDRRCETFMDEIMKQIEDGKLKGEQIEVNLTKILDYFRFRNMTYGLEDLSQAREIGFVGEAMVGVNNVMTCMVNMNVVNKYFYALKLHNVFQKFNDQKSGM